MAVKSKGIKKGEMINEVIFLLPMLLCFVPIVIVPFFYSIYVSFMKWNGISSTKVFVGLQNFINIFKEGGDFWASMAFSLKSTVAITLISNVLGLLLALLVCSLPKKMQGISRTLLLLPNIMGGVIMGFIWKFIFQKGFIALAKVPFLSFLNQSWLGMPTPAFWAVVIVSCWQYAGYTMIIYIAGLCEIPQDVTEAAIIDGCSPIRKFFSITLPLIMPSITICIFWVMVKAVTMYDLTSSLTAGGPFKSTMTVSMELYAEAFTRNNYGLGSAKAIVFFFLILVISVLQVKLTKSREVNL